MSRIAPENQAQQQYWNEPGGTTWTAWQQRMDTQLAPFGDAAIEAANPQTGERVLDVGCGCGHTTLQIADLVGASGKSIGLDISQPMLARGVERAAASEADNATFVLADAQVAATQDIGGAVDAIVSRFGVMFFADPTAAFTNIGTLLQPDGRMAFVCWQTPKTNSWMSGLGRELASLFPDQPPMDPTAPGPFAFADPERVCSILTASGWGDVDATPCVRTMQLFGTSDFDTAVEGSIRLGGAGRLLIGASDDLVAQARTIAEGVMREMWTEEGALVNGSTWLVTATK